MNGRFGGGGLPMTPACLMNDSLLDISFYNQVITGLKIFGIINTLKTNHGLHAYAPDWTHLRGSKIVIDNLNYVPDAMKDPKNEQP